MRIWITKKLYIIKIKKVIRYLDKLDKDKSNNNFFLIVIFLIVNKEYK